jgi:hypothetical protein
MEVSMARFTDVMVRERVRPLWAALQRGEFIADAAARVGRYGKKGTRWVAGAGGVRPRRGLRGRYLSFAEREEIALARARGESMRCIARRLGRSPATVSRATGMRIASISIGTTLISPGAGRARYPAALTSP